MPAMTKLGIILVLLGLLTAPVSFTGPQPTDGSFLRLNLKVNTNRAASQLKPAMIDSHAHQLNKTGSACIRKGGTSDGQTEACTDHR